MFPCKSSSRQGNDIKEEHFQGVENKPCNPVIWVNGVPVPMEKWVDRVAGFIELYDRALLIHTCNFHHGQQHPEVVSTILLYNLGLVHHIRGLHYCGGFVTNKFLKDAYCLYEISFCILKRNNAANVDPLLYLALLNNMAHIATGLSLTDRLYDELDAMCSIIQCESDFLEDEDLAIFCVNAMCGSSMIARVAPAA
jgi:hypothetical protein